MSKAFITGSVAYGTVNENSDVDLVIRCDEETRKILVEKFVAEDEKEKYPDIHQIKVGKLNLLLCVTDRQYRDWEKGTTALKAIAPVCRDVAVSLFKSIRAAPDSEEANSAESPISDLSFEQLIDI